MCPVTAEVFGPGLSPLFLLGLCEGWGLVAREKEFHFVPSEAEALALLSGLPGRIDWALSVTQEPVSPHHPVDPHSQNLQPPCPPGASLCGSEGQPLLAHSERVTS